MNDIIESLHAAARSSTPQTKRDLNASAHDFLIDNGALVSGQGWMVLTEGGGEEGRRGSSLKIQSSRSSTHTV